MGQVTGAYGATTWQAQDLGFGTYNETPLAFGSQFNTSGQAQVYRALPGTYYEGGYHQVEGGDGYHYHYNYDFEYVKTSGGIGMGEKEDDYADVEKYYFPDGTKFEINDDGQITRSEWDITNIGDIRHTPAGWWNPADPTFAPDEYSVWTDFIEVLEQRPNDQFGGILGSTGYPWDALGAAITIIGQYIASDYNQPTVFRSGLSGNFLTPTGDTNGAYAGFMGGFLADDARGVQGRVYGVYIGPNDATAGVLTGSYTGNLYSGIGMWDATGTLSATSLSSNLTGVTKDNLSDNLIYGNVLSEMMGYFKSGTSPVSGSIIGTMPASGDTLSIKGQDWGVYNLAFWAGGYGVPSSTLYTDWSAQLRGIGQFGEYQDTTVPNSPTWQPDTGVSLVPINNGTLTGGVMKGSATDGKFMTMTKMGTISADLLGIYTPPATIAPDTLYSWQGLAGGVWKKTQDLTFSSGFGGSVQRFAVQHYGYNESDGYRPYYYTYYTDVNWGDISFFSDAARTLTTSIRYEPDEGPSSIPMWEKFTYNRSTGEFTAYSSGTEGYPSSFSDQFFTELAKSKGYSDPSYTGQWSDLTGSGSISAIMGGVGDLWSLIEPPASPNIYFLGDYESWYGKPSIFGADIESYNVKNDTETTLDGQGAYNGYIGGIEMDGAIDGKIYAIYLNKIDGSASKAGILKGAFTGTAYQDIEMWEGTGGMYPVYLMDVSVPYTSLAGSIYENYFHSSGNVSFTLNDEPMGGETSPFTSQGQYSAFYSEAGSWGVWQSALGGVYSGIAGLSPNTPISDSWSASLEYIDSTRIMGQEVTGTKWSGNKIEGTTIGYGADTNIPATWVSVGEVMGTFDPTHYTFQVGMMGVSFETNTFLALASTEAGQAKLQALNIPAVQVGSANLTQAPGTVNNLSSVFMNNVTFFATSTGSAPRIWATNAVGGNYISTGPTPGGAAVNLSSGTGPNNITANFNIQQWSGTGANWGATVTNGMTNGTAQIGGYGVQFRGAAAGTIGTGTFSGTAAGIAK